MRAFLAEAAHAIGRRSGLQTLHLSIALLGGLADQVPEALVRELASVHTLEKVTLSLMACQRADRSECPPTFSLAHLVAGLAGLPRLRALTLFVANVGMDAVLPASVSRLAQLTYLRLRELHGLRCAPGWARLPALVCLDFHECMFAADSEAALPGMGALAALTSLCIWRYPRMRVLPASLWRLPQLRHLSHQADNGAGTGAPRSELPGAGLPLSAPCFASMLRLSLAGHSLRAFPPGVLAMKCLVLLDLSGSCFEQLPEGVSALTALEELRLGRHAAGELEIGGSLDARARGSLAGFPKLRRLSFANCSVLFCSHFLAAAAHPRLERLELRASHPVLYPSCGAFVAFVITLLQQGRADEFKLTDGAIKGAGQHDSRHFRAALRAVGYPLSAADSRDLL